MKYTLALIMLLLKFSFSSDAFYYSIRIEFESSHNIRKHGFQKNEYLIKPNVKYTLPGEIGFNTGVRIRGNLEGNLRQDSKYEFELRQFTLAREFDYININLGLQSYVWGQADGIKLLDVINPQEFDEFILDDFEESRIPLWMLNVEYIADNFEIQLLWIPAKKYHNLPEVNSEFEFKERKMLQLYSENYSLEFEENDLPDRFFRDSDIGLKISSQLVGWDLSLNYLYHYYDFPLFETNIDEGNKTINITPVYKRTNLFGGTASGSFNEYVLRIEFGYSSDRYFTNSDNSNTFISKNEFGYVVGVDYSGFRNILLSFQLHQQALVNYNYGPLLDVITTNITSLITKNYLNETIKAELFLIHNIDDGDGLLRPKIHYDIDDKTGIWLSIDYFYGNKYSLFGQFSNSSRVSLGLKYIL